MRLFSEKYSTYVVPLLLAMYWRRYYIEICFYFVMKTKISSISNMSISFLEGLTTDCQSVLTDSSRKMPWSEQETRTLLEIWGQDCVQIKLRGCLKNRHVFEYISQKMIAQGFIRTAEQCHTRVKRVKAGYVHEK